MAPFAPNFETRKQVEAHLIVGNGEGWVLVEMAGERVRVDVPLGFFAREMPEPGASMLVRYADGYVSHCPRDVFERDAHPMTPLPRTDLPLPDEPRVPRREHLAGADPRLPAGRHHP